MESTTVFSLVNFFSSKNQQGSIDKKCSEWYHCVWNVLCDSLTNSLEVLSGVHSFDSASVYRFEQSYMYRENWLNWENLVPGAFFPSAWCNFILWSIPQILLCLYILKVIIFFLKFENRKKLERMNTCLKVGEKKRKCIGCSCWIFWRQFSLCFYSQIRYYRHTCSTFYSD